MDGSHAPAPQPARRAFTGEEVLRMQAAGILPLDQRRELLEGDLYDMPAEGGPHIHLKVLLNRHLARTLPDDIALAPDSTLRLAERVWPEPDFYLYPAAMHPADVRGPDTLLVIEIADSSLAHDLGYKARLYREHGVRDYWVIDLEGRVTHPHRLDGAWPAPPVPFAQSLTAALAPVTLRLADFAAG